ncbi:MAG: hypothetical protein ACXVW7_20445 [Trebonia sp.]
MPVTATGAGAAAGAVGVTVGVGAGVVGGGVTVVGVTVVGVAVGVSWQVQVGVGAAVVVADAVVVGWSPPGACDASAECEANSTVKLVTASVMLANPAILARFVIFTAVMRCLLGCDKNRARGQ